VRTGSLTAVAVDGMHPTFKQTPPQYFSSTTLLLDHGNGVAELSGADGGDMAAGT